MSKQRRPGHSQRPHARGSSLYHRFEDHGHTEAPKAGPTPSAVTGPTAGPASQPTANPSKGEPPPPSRAKEPRPAEGELKVLALCGDCGTQYDVSKHRAGEKLRCPCGGTLEVPQPRKAVAHVARCASCGGPRTEAGERCTFCGSKFVDAFDLDRSLICPGCFIGLPKESRFCVECGIKIAPRRLPEETPEYACPRCRSPLALHAFQSPGHHTELFDCRQCGGLWVPEQTFDSIVATREGLGAARTLTGLAAQGDAKTVAAPVRQEDLVKYIPCPCCKNLMNRRNFGQMSGVIVDSCKGHGVWLDAEELNRIVRFIEGGGLEKARAREHEQQLTRSSDKPVTAGHLAADRALFEDRRPVGDDLLEGIVRGVFNLLLK